MSNSVDNRVVSMEFDNAKFERNVAQSLDTLKHLDKSLDGLVDSSKKFDGVSFEDLANSIDSIASKFTLMGRITMRVFDEIADGIVNLGKKLLDFNIDQVSSGWEKYADKTEAVQTIMSATGKDIDYVSEQLRRLNRFTDETSYSFTDMTGNIAKFTSQGIDLESAITQMQGIATWAASAGRNAQEASRAMYNISQAMGAGSMKLIDWKSIQNANMATKEFKEQAIAAGLAAKTLVEQEGKIVTENGKIEVSIQNFDQTLQKGWFNTEAMTKVFTEYGKFADVIDEVSESTGLEVTQLLQLAKAQKKSEEALQDQARRYEMTKDEIDAVRDSLTLLNSEEYEFSKRTYAAAQEAKTFRDAINAAKDAISTAWMNLFETIFGDYEKQKELWTDLANWFWELFAEPINKLRKKVVQPLMETTGKEVDATKQFNEAVKSSGVDLTKYGDIAVKVLKKHGLLTDEMIEKYGSIENAIKHLSGSSDQFSKAIDDMVQETSKSLTEGKKDFDDYMKTAKEVLRGDWGNGADRRARLSEAGYDYKVVQELANRLHAQLKINREDYEDLCIKSNKYTDQADDGLKKLQKDFEENIKEIEDTRDALDKLTGWELLFGKQEENQGAFYNIIDSISALKDTAVEAYEEIFDGDRVNQLREILKNINRSTAAMKETIEKSKNLKKAFKGLFAVINILSNAFTTVFRIVKSFVSVFMPSQKVIGDMVGTFGDWLVAINDWLEKNEIFDKAVEESTKLFIRLKEAIDPAIQKVKEFFSSFDSSEALAKVVEWIEKLYKGAIHIGGTALGAIVIGISMVIGKVQELYGKYLSPLVDKDKTFFLEIKNGERTTNSAFTKIKSAVVDFFKILINFVKTKDIGKFFEDFTNRFTALANWFIKTRNSVKAFLEQFDFLRVGVILKLAAAIITLTGALKFLKRFGTIHGAVVNVLNTLSKTIASYNRGVQTNNILKIAAAIGILVSALLVLAYMPEDKMLKGMDALMKIMTGFVAIMGLATLIGLAAKSGNMAGLAGVIGGIAAVLIASVLSLWVLTSKIDYKKIQPALETLFKVMLIAVAGVVAVSLLAGKAKVGITSMVALAAGILLMVYALEKIQNSAAILTPRAFENFFRLLSLLLLASFTMRRASISGALGLLVFVLSLSTINKTLIKLMDEILPAEVYKSKMDDFWGLIKMISAIAVALRIGGKARLGTAISIIAVIIAIYELAKAAANIGKLPAVEITRGLDVVENIGYMLAVIIAVMGIAARLSRGGKGFATAVIAIVVALIAIGIEIVAISNLGWEGMLPGLVAMGGILLGLAAVFGSLASVGANFKPSSLLSLVEVLGVVAIVYGAIYALSTYGNPDTMLQAAESLGLVLVALGVAMKLMSGANLNGFNSNDAWQQIIQFVILAGVAIGALWALQALNIQTSIETVGALALLIIVLAVAARIMSKCTNDLGSSVGNAVLVAGLAASLILIAIAMQKLNDVNVEGILPKAEALAILLATIGGVVFILSLIPDTTWAGGIVQGVIGFLGILLGLVVITEIIGILEGIPFFAGKLESGATALGKAISGFASAFKEDETEKATEDISHIEKFANDLKGLVEVLNGIDLNTESVEALAKVLIALGTAEIKDAIANFINTKLGDNSDDLTTKLTGFATAVTGYVTALHELNAGDLYKAVAITNAISKLLTALPKEGGVAGWLLGTKSTTIENLSQNLGGFAESVVEMSQKLSEFSDSDVEHITKFSKALDSLIEVLNKIEKTGGIWQKITGTVDLTTFGTSLTSFINNLVGGQQRGTGTTEGIFGKLKNITDDDINSFDTLKKIIDKLAEATSSIPQLGGVADFIFGTDSPAEFGTQMVTLCEKIVEIGDKAKGITDGHIESIEEATKAAYALNAFSNAMYGTSLPTEPSQNLSDSAENFKEASATLNSADFQKTEEQTGRLENIMGMFKGLGGGDGTTLDLSSVQTSLAGLGDAAESGITSVLTSFSSHTEELNAAGQSVPTEIANGIAQGSGDLETATTGLETTVTTSMEAIQQTATTSGEGVTIGFFNGMLNKFKDSELLNAFVEGASEALSESNPQILDIGHKFCDTVITGMGDRNEDAYNNAAGIVDAAVAGATERLDIQADPEGGTSQTAAELGKTFGNGFVKGVDLKTDKVHDIGVTMVDFLLQGVRSKVDDADTIGEEIAQPIADALSLAITSMSETTVMPVGAEMVNSVVAGVDMSAETSSLAGQTIVASVVGGMGEKQVDVETMSQALSDAGAAKITATQPTWIEAGHFVAEGLAQGLDERADVVRTAANNLATIAEIAIRSALGIHSPSRVAIGLGEFFGEGFGIGIHNMFSYVHTASESLSETATDAISEAARLASAIIESDANPVITPVLDLSEVRRGAASISNMGSFAASVSASRANMVYDSAFARTIQNGTPTPTTAVLSDSAIRALAARQTTPNKTVIEFTGDLAQLARVLHPVIVDQYNYHGDKLIN